MAEFQARSCGPCPVLGKYDKADENGDYFQRNTIPQPELLIQDHTTLEDHNLGVVRTHFPPDLSVSPTGGDQQLGVVGAKHTPLGQHQSVNNPSCKETCLQKPAPISPEKCPSSPYVLQQSNVETKHSSSALNNQCTNKGVNLQEAASPQLKGILKNGNKSADPNCCCQAMNATAGMAATAGRLPPGQIDPSAQVPVPNELRPLAPSGQLPCYLPQPEDDIMKQPDENGMGPIGPWATGRLDWGPLAGLTGTRPVVDKYSIARFSEGEWRRHNKEMLDMATLEQHKANLIDWNGRRCLEQTRADVDKDQEDNTKRLSQREQDLHRWKCELERAIAAAAEEIGFMEEQRRRLKQASAVLQMPEAIAGECLERRTGRLDPELVRDEVEEELIRELALTAEIRDQFTRTLKDIEIQLLEDKTAKRRLEYDWSDKKYAHELEAINVALNVRSTVLLFKPGAVRFQEDQSTEEHWENFTRETLQEGEATRQRSVALRGTLDAILINASRDLRSQADRVDNALAKRIACTEAIREQLENNLKNILQRLATVEDLVRDIRDAIRSLDLPMKKAQTRLDNRQLRPRVENCRDAANFGLIEEVKSIGENVAALMAQLKQAEASQNSLIKARNDLEKEIMMKRKTLEIDRDRTALIRSYYPSATALSGH